jgi:hypothetical protein
MGSAASYRPMTPDFDKFGPFSEQPILGMHFSQQCDLISIVTGYNEIDSTVGPEIEIADEIADTCIVSDSVLYIGADIGAGVGTDYYKNFNGADKCQENLHIKFIVIPYNELDATVDSQMTISAEVGPVFGKDDSMEISSKIGSGVGADNMDPEIKPDINPTSYSSISSQLSTKGPKIGPYEFYHQLDGVMEFGQNVIESEASLVLQLALELDLGLRLDLINKSGIIR